MMPELLIPVLLAGFALGLLHALDPDHLMTIAALSARPDAKGVTLRYAALWALGHGGLLVALAAAVLMLGWVLPEALPAGAEWSGPRGSMAKVFPSLPNGAMFFLVRT